MSVTILLLGAGRSARMKGDDKLSREIDGEPLLHRTARIASESGAPVRVVTNRSHLIADLPVECVAGGDSMSDSLRAGMQGLDAGAVIIALADMPEITATDYGRLIAGHPDHAILRLTTSDGIPGHPVLFDRRFFGELTEISGDIGPKAVLQRHADELRLIQGEGQAAITDLDTEEDWKNYRK